MDWLLDYYIKGKMIVNRSIAIIPKRYKSVSLSIGLSSVILLCTFL